MQRQTTNTDDRIQIGDKVNIQPRGKKGIYVADFWHLGRHTRRSLKTSNLKVARQRAITLEAELEGGEYKPRAKSIAVAAAGKEFVQAKKNEGKAKKTIAAYEPEVDLFVQFLTGRGQHLLTQLHQRDYEEYRALREPNLAAKTLYTRLTIIKTFIKWCLTSRGYLDRNPFAGCKLAKPYVPPKFTPTPQQVEVLLNGATGERQIQFALLAYAGLRAGELQMLGTRGVDLAGGWIQIVGREGWVPKTRQARKIPIHPKLLPYLRRVPRGERPYFFCASPSPKYSVGGHHINCKHLNEDLQKLAKSLGIAVGRNDNGVVVHSLRHFFETQCVNSGVPQFMTDTWMGHAGQALMGRQYYGLTDEKAQEQMKRVIF